MMKKSNFVYVIQNGKLIKRRNINEISLKKVLSFIKRDSEIILKKLDENIYEYRSFIVIFRGYQREHTNYKNTDINYEESFRSRYTKKDIEKFKFHYQKTGKFVVVLSYYYTLDKVILTATEITSILFTKKSKIKSDSRVNSMKCNDFFRTYKSNSIEKIDYSPRSLIPYTYSFNSNNFFSFFEKIERNELVFPKFKKLKTDDFEKDVSSIWKKTSFIMIKKHLSNNKTNEFTGELGEYIAFLILNSMNKNSVIWASKLNFYSSYDIEIEGKRYYEIKSSKEDSNTFYISNSEKKFMEEKSGLWSLWRMFLKNIVDDLDFDLIENEKVLRKIILSKIESDDITYKAFKMEEINKKIKEPTGYRVQI